MLLLAGLGGLGWAGYEVFLNPLVDPRAAAQNVSDLKDEWKQEAAAKTPTAEKTPFKAVPGKAMALLRVPAFGKDFEQPVLVGTDDATLARGLGWYETTAKPGQIGNFAVAGHRGTRGPFSPMPVLHPGDTIEVETRDAVYTYTVDNEPGQQMVMNTDVWVLDPVPGKTNVKPTEARITLTTCFDLYHSPRRMILFGHLTNTVTK